MVEIVVSFWVKKLRLGKKRFNQVYMQGTYDLHMQSGQREREKKKKRMIHEKFTGKHKSSHQTSKDYMHFIYVTRNYSSS